MVKHEKGCEWSNFGEITVDTDPSYDMDPEFRERLSISLLKIEYENGYGSSDDPEEDGYVPEKYTSIWAVNFCPGCGVKLR